MTANEVIEKYFGYERTKYFHSSDAHKNLEGDTYLTYGKWGDGRIELYIGGDNGEFCLIVTDDAEKLETLIKIITRVS